MAIGKTEISQRGTVKEHEETVTAAVRENSTKYKERNPQKISSGMACPERLGTFHLWKSSKLDWIMPQATCPTFEISPI